MKGPPAVDTIKLNLGVPPASGAADRFGVIGGDLAGFPNGRRLDDDVVDIELQVVAGFLKGNKVPLGDGVDRNDKPFLSAFPYLAGPTSGFDSDPSNRSSRATRRCRRAAESDSRQGGGALGRPLHPRRSSDMTLTRPNLHQASPPARRLLRPAGGAHRGQRLRRPGARRAGRGPGGAQRRRRRGLPARRAGRPRQRRRLRRARARPTFSARARPAIRRFYSRAGRSFGAALRRDPRELGALIGAGALAGLRHDFHEQLRLGIEARRVAPDLARPLTVVADAQIELGRYGDAGALDPAPPRHEAGPRLVLARLLPARAERRPGRRRRGDAAGGVGRRRLAREPRVRPGAAGRPRASARTARPRRATPTWPRSAPCAEHPPALVGLARVDAAARPPGRGDRPPAARHAAASAHRPA